MTPSWTKRAACIGVDTERFFDESARPAKLICNTCPVIEECLQYALDNHINYGVFGGKSAGERRALKYGLKAPERWCRTCPTRIVPARQWRAMPKTDRLELVKSGWIYHMARGLCSRCYTKERAAAK